MTDGAVLVTGAQRSGTTLLGALLDAQRDVSVLSQPFPLLFAETKSAFLRSMGFEHEGYPLGHLFLENRYHGDAFSRFLSSWRTTPAELDSLFARMQHYSGQYTRFSREQLAEAFSRLPVGADFAEVVARLDRSLAVGTGASHFGSKETTCEEYVAPLLDRGFRCAVIVRDPRDVVASLNHGRGREFGGELKPTLFNIRMWRKSVAMALAMEGHPRFVWCRYETLVSDPPGELGRILHSLGLGPVDSADIRWDIRDSSGAVWRGNSSHGDHEGVSTKSVAAHRAVLSPAVALYVEAACLPELQLLGYDTTLSRASAVRILDRFQEPYDITRRNTDSDRATPANAALEAERLERVSRAPDEESAPWFLSARAHARLREAFRQ